MKTVLLTGASSGLGVLLAKELLEKNYFVILHYFQHEKEVFQLHEKYPNSSFLISCDLSKELEIKKMKEALQDKKVDILINNAAIEHLSELEEKNEETFMKVLKVNTIGPFLLMKYFGTDINERKGSIVNISSDNAIDKYDLVTIEYDVSKIGLNLMTKIFADYFHDASINAICFGWLDTAMNDFPEDIKRKIPFYSKEKAVQRILELMESKETGKIELARKE